MSDRDSLVTSNAFMSNEERLCGVLAPNPMRSSPFSLPLLRPFSSLTLKFDRFYVIESGMLRANYVFPDHSHTVSESMVAGTIAGELSFLSRTERNTNVVAERDSVLWKMEVSSHEELGKKEGWQFARRFEEVLLKIANAETEGKLALSFTSQSPRFRLTSRWLLFAVLMVSTISRDTARLIDH